jgi:hypothetical protein
MKPLIPILVVATTSLAVASVQFARQAHTQRERADAETELRQKQDARVAQLERDQARLERELEALRAAAHSPPPPVAAVTAPAVSSPPPRAVARGAGQGDAVFTVIDRNDSNAPRPPAPGFRGPAFMETEAGRNYMKSRARSAIRRLHGDVGSALGLSEEQTNELLDLLADQQTRLTERFRSSPDGQPPQPLDMRQVQQKNNAEIAALIGQDRMDEWVAYQQSLPDRSQVNMVNQQLAEAGVPAMTDNQRAEMLAAITEERQNRPRPYVTPGMAPEEQFAQTSEWQAEYEKAVLARAKSILSSEQYQAYKEFQDFQSEMRKSLPRFAGPGGQVSFNAVSADTAVAGPAMGPAIVVAAPMSQGVTPVPPSPPPQIRP